MLLDLYVHILLGEEQGGSYGRYPDLAIKSCLQFAGVLGLFGGGRGLREI